MLLSARRIMARQGCIRIRNVNGTVKEIFEAAGFSGILTIE